MASLGGQAFFSYGKSGSILPNDIAILPREDQPKNIILIGPKVKAELFPEVDFIDASAPFPISLPDKNLIFCDGLNSETPVSQILKVWHLRAIFENRALSLVQPHEWDDPFENCFFQCYGVDGATGERVSLQALRDCWFAQSWSLRSENDAQWRIYGNPNPSNIDDSGVRIQTTLGKLRSACWDASDPFASITYAIGRVRYLERSQIESFLAKASFRAVTLGGSIEGPASTLLLKRDAFSHEDELRLLVMSGHGLAEKKIVEVHQNGQGKSKRLLRLPVEPNNLIDNILIDPRMHDIRVPLAESLIRKIGFSGTIAKSSLYEFNPVGISLD